MSHRPPAPSVLVVDDDYGTRATFQKALALEGFEVETATDTSSASRIVENRAFDLLFIDQYLGNDLGTHWLHEFRRRSSKTTFVAMSAFLTAKVVVEFMRLGAFDVLEKPIDLDTLIETARRAVANHASLLSRAELPDAAQDSSASGTRWAKYVIDACRSDADFRTLGHWARCVAVSYSTLCASCRIVGVRPHAARDFARVLRAIRQCLASGAPPATLLDVSDERTLEALIQKSGVDLRSRPHLSILNEFFAAQSFIDADNVGFKIVRNIVGRTQRMTT